MKGPTRAYFIGGPWDGTTRQLPTLEMVYIVSAPPPRYPAFWPDNENAPTTYIMPHHYRYRLQSTFGPRDAYSVYVDEDILYG